ncbi:MAG: hypothetical protein JWP14_3031 [Frankiales bacterium]|nr:hypothetical protein [Frankiales bacterium]
MTVPEQVRSAALAAFDERREGAVVLELLDDSFTGLWQLRQPLPDGVSRALVFAGPGLMARVYVLETEEDSSPVIPLRVQLTPERALYVEVLSPRADVHLRSGPGTSIDITAPDRGPLSLLLESNDVEAQRWQTSWITL